MKKIMLTLLCVFCISTATDKKEDSNCTSLTTLTTGLGMGTVCCILNNQALGAFFCFLGCYGHEIADKRAALVNLQPR